MKVSTVETGATHELILFEKAVERVGLHGTQAPSDQSVHSQTQLHICLSQTQVELLQCTETKLLESSNPSSSWFKNFLAQNGCPILRRHYVSQIVLLLANSDKSSEAASVLSEHGFECVL